MQLCSSLWLLGRLYRGMETQSHSLVVGQYWVCLNQGILELFKIPLFDVFNALEICLDCFLCQCSEHMMFVLTGALKLWGTRVSKYDRLSFKTQHTWLHFVAISSSAVQHVHIFHYEILTAEFIVWKAPQGQGIWRTCGWFPCGGLKRGSLCDESCCLGISSLSTERRVIWSWSSDLLTLVYSSWTYLNCWCFFSDVC